MPALPDARHERFAQLVADKHMSNAEAYRRALDKLEMKRRSTGASEKTS
jgi:hypothetical protein